MEEVRLPRNKTPPTSSHLPKDSVTERMLFFIAQDIYTHHCFPFWACLNILIYSVYIKLYVIC